MRIDRGLLVGLSLALSGCSGEPPARELKNRQEFETLLTAIAMKSPKQLEVSETRIVERHRLGELSDEGYKALDRLIKKASAGDWAEAEKAAYAFRESRPYFK